MTRIGLIGSRGIAAAHARAAADLSECEIVACAALHKDHAQSFAEQWKIPSAHDSIQGLLESAQVDIVILATWPADHLEQVRLCCRYPIRGILCEKALAMNLDEGLAMQRVTAESHVLLMEGLMYRHHPQIQEAARLTREGQIGRVGYITGYFSDRIVGTQDPDNWRFNPSLGGGTMTAKACYTIDCLSFLSGGRAESGIAYRTDAADGGCDVGHTALMIFDNGVTATFEANHRTVWREEITVYGETGSLVIPHAIVTATEPREILIRSGGRFEREPTEEERLRFGVEDSYRLQLANMVAWVNGAVDPGVPLEDSLNNLALTDALRRSTNSGRREQVSR